MIRKAKGRVLVRFEPEAKAFIDAAGLDSDVNLNVDGLYTAEEARYGINYLVSGLKSIGIWDKLNVIYPHIGGSAFSQMFNLKSPVDSDLSNRLTYHDNGRPPTTYNGYGVKGYVMNTHLTHDSYFNLNNLSVGYTLTTPNLVNESQEAGTGTANGGFSLTTQYNGHYGIRGIVPSQNFIAATETTGTVLWSRGVLKESNFRVNLNANLGVNNKYFVYGGYAIYDGLNEIVGTGGGSTGTIGFNFVGTYLTPNELDLMYNIINGYHRILRRFI